MVSGAKYQNGNFCQNTDVFWKQESVGSSPPQRSQRTLDTEKLQNLRNFGDFVVFPHVVSYEIVVVGMGPLILVFKKQLFSDKKELIEISLLKLKRNLLKFRMFVRKSVSGGFWKLGETYVNASFLSLLFSTWKQITKKQQISEKSLDFVVFLEAKEQGAPRSGAPIL